MIILQDKEVGRAAHGAAPLLDQEEPDIIELDITELENSNIHSSAQIDLQTHALVAVN